MRDIKKLGELSKDFMMKYVKDKGLEDEFWLVNLELNNYTNIEKTDKATGEKSSYRALDLATIRKAFCERYEEFSYLLDRKKMSYEDMLKARLEELKEQLGK